MCTLGHRFCCPHIAKELEVGYSACPNRQNGTSRSNHFSNREGKRQWEQEALKQRINTEQTCQSAPEDRALEYWSDLSRTHCCCRLLDSYLFRFHEATKHVSLSELGFVRYQASLLTCKNIPETWVIVSYAILETKCKCVCKLQGTFNTESPSA